MNHEAKQRITTAFKEAKDNGNIIFEEDLVELILNTCDCQRCPDPTEISAKGPVVIIRKKRNLGAKKRFEATYRDNGVDDKRLQPGDKVLKKGLQVLQYAPITPRR